MSPRNVCARFIERIIPEPKWHRLWPVRLSRGKWFAVIAHLGDGKL